MTSIWSHNPPPSPPSTDVPPSPPLTPGDAATAAPGQPAAAVLPPRSEAPASGSSLRPPTDWSTWSTDPTRPAATPTPPPPPPQHTSPSSSRRGGGGRAVIAALLATSLVGAGWIARDLAVDEAPPTVAAGAGAPAPTETQQGTTPAVPLDASEPVAAVATALAPAVVMVQAGQGLGSGFVYDADGLIMTNAHVVGSSRTVDVVFDDGSSVEGTVLGVEELTDVAVVKIEPTSELTVAPLATDEPQVGQLVVALGSPFGLEQTVTSGIVSATGRAVSNPQGATVEMLQTDAPINPGNSGGALANRAGEIVGVPTLIYSQSGENNGIGFAIPIQSALEVAGRITNGETLERGKLGVSTQPATDGSAGAMVADVESGSAADEAGLVRGDVIVAVDGDAVKGSAELAARIQAEQPGDQITLEVRRDGETLELEATLGRLGGG